MNIFRTLFSKILSPITYTSEMEARKRLIGNECLVNSHSSLLGNKTVLDFWQWAFSDLRANNVRGIFAEWLVAQLLNISIPVRDSWAEWDLETTNGIKIEVKTSAYLQTWQQKQPSKIVFSRLRGRKLDLVTNQYASSATYNADLYIFCVQVEQNPNKWNALDLSQWRFYILTNAQLAQRECESLSLGVLATITDELTAEEFCTKAKMMIESMTELC